MVRAAIYLGKCSSRGGATHVCEHVLFARNNKQPVLKKISFSSDCYLSLHHVTDVTRNWGTNDLLVKLLFQ